MDNNKKTARIRLLKNRIEEKTNKLRQNKFVGRTDGWVHWVEFKTNDGSGIVDSCCSYQSAKQEAKQHNFIYVERLNIRIQKDLNELSTLIGE